jgi:hypothetical protein
MGLTTGGNYSQQRRAKALSKFFEGVLDNVDFWSTREQRRRDAAIFGSGFAYNYRVGRKFVHDRAFPWELEVDPREAHVRQAAHAPPQALRRPARAHGALPEVREEIADAESKSDDDAFELGWDETCDLVLLRGAWHLRSERDANDGEVRALHLERDARALRLRARLPPFSKCDFLPALVGWRGQGMVKPLTGLQYEVNAIGMRLQENGYMTGSYVWVPPARGPRDRHARQRRALRHPEPRSKPEFMTPAPWHPAFFDYYLALRGRVPAEESRISELSTRGETPPELKSGKAIQRGTTTSSRGLRSAGRADERDVIDTCWQLFDLAEEIYAESGEQVDSARERQEKKKRETYTVRVESKRARPLGARDARLRRRCVSTETVRAARVPDVVPPRHARRESRSRSGAHRLAASSRKTKR